MTERRDEGVARIQDLTKGVGADSVLECVGTQESMMQAINSTRPGGFVSYVGVPHGVELKGAQLFYTHVHLHGGPAPVRRYLPKLIDLVWNGKINPGKVFDLVLPLDQVAEAYRAMDERRAIKTLLLPQAAYEGYAMSNWTKDELEKVAGTDELHISPRREDGTTYRAPTTIWSVVIDGELYVRAYNGRDSRWYRAAMRQKTGRISAAGVTKEVAFEPVEGAIQDRIDEAYRTKYKGSEYLSPMISDRARSATVKVTPRETSGK